MGLNGNSTARNDRRRLPHNLRRAIINKTKPDHPIQCYFVSFFEVKGAESAVSLIRLSLSFRRPPIGGFFVGNLGWLVG